MKMRRARQFIEELRAELYRFRSTDPLHVTLTGVQEQPPPENAKLALDVPMQVHWDAIGLLPGTIVGDSIHNMRTALDLMASELARLNARSDKNVYFPFAESQDKLQTAIKSKSFDFAGADAVALLESFAPYRGGNDLLRAIHDLDIRDKHTALIPAGSFAEVQVNWTTTPNDDGVTSTLTFRANVDNDSISYMFPPETPFEGKPIIETLEDLATAVEGVLDAFAGLVASRPT